MIHISVVPRGALCRPGHSGNSSHTVGPLAKNRNMRYSLLCLLALTSFSPAQGLDYTNGLTEAAPEQAADPLIPGASAVAVPWHTISLVQSGTPGITDAFQPTRLGEGLQHALSAIGWDEHTYTFRFTPMLGNYRVDTWGVYSGQTMPSFTQGPDCSYPGFPTNPKASKRFNGVSMGIEYEFGDGDPPVNCHWIVLVWTDNFLLRYPFHHDWQDPKGGWWMIDDGGIDVSGTDLGFYDVSRGLPWATSKVAATNTPNFDMINTEQCYYQFLNASWEQYAFIAYFTDDRGNPTDSVTSNIAISQYGVGMGFHSYP